MPDPFGRAIRDHAHGERTDSLLQVDGEAARDHPIERFYFGDDDSEDPADDWLTSHLDGPLLDMGAGAGRHALFFQDRFETVAIEPSQHLVETMRHRGVDDARQADMFALRETFAPDRFRSALAIGTQLGLAGSMGGLRQFLADLAVVTTDDATAVLDSYDPDHLAPDDLLGYRTDPTPGLAHRVMHFEYEDDTGDTLYFRLFSPDRLREATLGTPWSIAHVSLGADDDPRHYRAALAK